MVVVKHVFGNTTPQFSNGTVSTEKDAFVFQGSPESFDIDIVQSSSFSIHTDAYSSAFKGAGECITGELTSLVSVEYLWTSMCQSFFKRFYTKTWIHRIRYTP